MTERPTKGAFATRPASPEAWVRSPDARVGAADPTDSFSARLTIDVTPQMRGRIKIAAFRRGQTVADMLRGLLEREFPDTDGAAS